MQIGGGTKWNGYGWQAYGRDQYSQHEAYVLNSLDVKVGVDISWKTNHISAEWWSSTKGYCFYSSLKKMIRSINETDPSYQNAKKFIDLIQSQLETIINLRKQKNIEIFKKTHHPPIEQVLTNEDNYRNYIQFIKSYGGHINYLKHITIAYYLLHLMPKPKVQSILYQTPRVLTSIVDLAKEYAEFKCNQNYTEIPALNKWRNDYNKISLELTPEEYNKHQFWNRRPLLCNQHHGGKSRQRRKSIRHSRRKQRRKSTRHRRYKQHKKLPRKDPY